MGKDQCADLDMGKRCRAGTETGGNEGGLI